MKTTWLIILAAAVAGGVVTLILGAGSLNPLGLARAEGLGPEVTGGAQPYLAFSGSNTTGATLTIYTVPADRVLVVTGATMQSRFCDLFENGETRVDGTSGAMYGGSTSDAPGGVLGTGAGKVPFAPGSTVGVSNNCAYFVQGYLARP